VPFQLAEPLPFFNSHKQKRLDKQTIICVIYLLATRHWKFVSSMLHFKPAPEVFVSRLGLAIGYNSRGVNGDTRTPGVKTHR
jgi:hypothetical protein